jgi:hypothetical protein
MPHSYEINPDKLGRRYAPVGCCIYCGALEYAPDASHPLSDEHIIAEGLGGTLVLPEASCESCGKATTKIEGAVLRTVLWTPRAHLGIRGKRRERPKEPRFPLTAIVEGQEVKVELPIQEYPTALHLLGFGLPRMLDATRTGPQEAYVWLKALNFADSPLFQAGVSFHGPIIDRVRFAQLLAKTAHAFAVAELGTSGFAPLLPEAILKNPDLWGASGLEEMEALIGGLPDQPPSDVLHEIGWNTIEAGGKRYAVVVLRLFANLGAPVYLIVVGEHR